MSKRIQLIAILVTLSLLSACTATHQERGVMTGGVIGGLLGSRFGKGPGRAVAVAAGTLAGVMIGGEIGRYMDNNDRRNLNKTLERLPDGRTRRWRNPNTGYQYRVEPTRTYYRKVHAGVKQPCREYHTTATIGGRERQIYGTACRQADGAWKVTA